MVEQASINLKHFNEMEKHLLDQVVEVSNSLIGQFKFRLIYGTKVTSGQSRQTLKALREFRSKNWDKSVSRKEAYRKYINLYN